MANVLAYSMYIRERSTGASRFKILWRRCSATYPRQRDPSPGVCRYRVTEGEFIRDEGKVFLGGGGGVAAASKVQALAVL